MQADKRERSIDVVEASTMHDAIAVRIRICRSLVWMALALAPSMSLARTIFVDDDAKGARTGRTWANAYPRLQEALDNSQAWDEIRIAEGVYRPERLNPGSDPTLSANRQTRFNLKSGMTLLGGYAGVAHADPNIRDVALYKTVISGDILDNDASPSDVRELLGHSTRQDNAYHVMYVSGASYPICLNGLTLKGGNANGSSNERFGGAILSLASTLIVEDCRFTENSATATGGAMNNYDNCLLVDRCVFTRNYTGQDAGAVDIWICDSAAFLDCTFDANVTAKSGGALRIRQGPGVLTRCTFTGNSATWGGAVACQDSVSRLAYCRFTGNQAVHGGGIHNESCGDANEMPILESSAFEGNSASNSGGATMSFDSGARLSCCTFVRNTAKTLGGAVAIYSTAATTTFEGSLLLKNSAAQQGGAISVSGSRLTSVNCTMGGNAAPQGAGIACMADDGGVPGHVQISNTIAWDADSEIDSSGDSTVDVLHSDVRGGWAGKNDLLADPCFAALSQDDCRLREVSPCIDAGDNAAVPTHLTTDLDGRKRVAGSSVDMGAYESVPADAAEPGEAVYETDFATSLPDGWTTVNYLNDEFAWSWAGPDQPAYQVLASSAMVVRSSSVVKEELITPVLDCTTCQAVILRFRHVFHPDSYGACEVGDVDIRVGGGEWVNLARYSEVEYSGYVEMDISACAAGRADVQIRWNYHKTIIVIVPQGTPYEAFWAVDDVQIVSPSRARRLVLYVDDDAGPSGDGSSWSRACRSLQDALAQAQSGSEIRVAQGKYWPDRGRDHVSMDANETFSLLNGVAIRGGYAGAGYADPDARNPQVYRTCLSGDLRDDDLPGFRNRTDNARHVVTALGTNRTAVLDGFWITGGCADGDGERSLLSTGGGLLSSNSSSAIIGCVFHDNWAQYGGGLGHYLTGLPYICNCVFSGNGSTEGGGLYLEGSEYDVEGPSVVNCLFLDNTAEAGAGVYNNWIYPTFTNCTFIGNSAESGGAMFNWSNSRPTLNNCIVTQNLGTGIVDTYFGTALLDHCTVWGNAPYEIYQWWQEPLMGHDRLEIRHSNILGGPDYINANFDVRIVSVNGPAPTDPQRDDVILWDANNIDVEPAVTPAGWLIHDSPLIDAGDSCLVPWDILDLDRDGFTEERLPFDIHGSARLVDWFHDAGRPEDAPAPVDMGPAETADADNDGLPDWWEAQYFPNTGDGVATVDSDGDGISNLQEYELYASNPAAGPLFVDSTNGSDSYDGKSLHRAGSNAGSKRTLQAAIEAAASGDTILVARGIYGGEGNRNLRLERKSLIVRSLAGPNDTTINLYGESPAVERTATDVPGNILGQEKVTSTITVDDSGVIDDLNVTVRITGFNTRYTVYLYGPDGTRVSLMSGFPDIIDFDGTTLDDEASRSIEDGKAPYAGVYRPEGQLRDYYGKDIRGAWTVEITTPWDDPGTGTLVTWSLQARLNPGRLLEPNSDEGLFVVFDGFTITGGQASVGAGVRTQNARLRLKDCLLTDNHAAVKAGGLYCDTSILTLDGVSLGPNTASAGEPNAGVIQSSLLYLPSALDLQQGCLDVIRSLLYGDGGITLAPGAQIRVAGDSENRPSILRTSVSGPGQITIEPGQRLIVEGSATVNLGVSPGRPADPETDGRITVHGSLSVRDTAAIESTNIDVKLFDMENPGVIRNNNIKLMEASTAFGGEFYVGDSARIIDNNIVSEGDRYLDLDPDPEQPNHPTLTGNRISVIIKEGTLGSQGTLLELRARDHHGKDQSGVHRVSWKDADFADDDAGNWMLDKLEIKPNAKLNLTNRQGFEFQDRTVTTPETVYVKQLVMGPNAVLNTALQTLYYERLTDPSGREFTLDPDTRFAQLPNGARFDDVPLLGFSLGIIAMDDPNEPPHNEFDVRVRRRLTDPHDKNPAPPAEPEFTGSIQRMDVDPVLFPQTLGVMVMCTQAPGKQPATSVAAKGAFARAGDEDITVKFEYRFLDNPDGQAQIIVYLSDHPEVGKRLREVARLRPPASGEPGAPDSDLFTLFSGTFDRADLNFTRGTYVELELRGRGARCWIDNWDPTIQCQYTKCGDHDNNAVVTLRDYLMAVHELAVPGFDAGKKGCLDMVADGAMTADDLLLWDTSSDLNACPFKSHGPDSSAHSASQARALWSALSDTPPDPEQLRAMNEQAPLVLLCRAESQSPQRTLDNRLYRTTLDGAYVEAQQTPGNGRLIADGHGRVWQISKGSHVLDTATSTAVIRQDPNEPCQGKSVSVGFNGGYDFGVPLLDAAFHPTDPQVLYVAPVRVNGARPYQAAAKLRRDGQGGYAVETLYGRHPLDEPNQAIDPNQMRLAGDVVWDPDYQHLKEIEVSPDGQYVYVLSSHATNHNDWVLVYEESTGRRCGLLRLSGTRIKTPVVNAPSAMLVSAAGDTLVMASSRRDGDTSATGSDPEVISLWDRTVRLYRYDIRPSPDRQSVQLGYRDMVNIVFPEPDDSLFKDYRHVIEPHRYAAMITAVTQDPAGTLYAAGFCAPQLTADVWSRLPSETTVFFTKPVLAEVPVDGRGPIQARIMADWPANGVIPLPLSIVWNGAPAGQ